MLGIDARRISFLALKPDGIRSVLVGSHVFPLGALQQPARQCHQVYRAREGTVQQAARRGFIAARGYHRPRISGEDQPGLFRAIRRLSLPAPGWGNRQQALWGISRAPMHLMGADQPAEWATP